MKVTHTTKYNDFPEVKKQIDLINGAGVEVGVLRGEKQWLAAIHEYGCDIEVTPKMRKFLASQGMRLKKTTKHIHIPERSFLRAGYDKHRDAVGRKASRLLADVTAGKITARGCYQATGIELSSKIKEYAVELDNPPNHPFTADRKGSSNPLVDTGEMIGGITWRKSK